MWPPPPPRKKKTTTRSKGDSTAVFGQLGINPQHYLPSLAWQKVGDWGRGRGGNPSLVLSYICDHFIILVVKVSLTWPRRSLFYSTLPNATVLSHAHLLTFTLSSRPCHYWSLSFSASQTLFISPQSDPLPTILVYLNSVDPIIPGFLHWTVKPQPYHLLTYLSYIYFFLLCFPIPLLCLVHSYVAYVFWVL